MTEVILSSAILLVPLLLALAGAIYLKGQDPFHPALVIIGSFTLLVAVNLAFADAVSFYPLKASGVGAIVLGLTSLAAGVVIANLAYPPTPLPSSRGMLDRLDQTSILVFAILMFGLFLASNLLYWRDVQRLFGLTTILLNPGKLKAAELLGTINPNALKYFFRTTTLIPVVLVLAVYRNPGLRLPKLILIVYLLLSLIQVRRDPILALYSTSLATAIIVVEKSRKLVGPVILGMVALLLVSSVLLFTLATLHLPVGTVLFGYTAGNLSSFQAVLDGFYPPAPTYPMENTFYILFSLLKYVDPVMAPQNVIKPNPWQPILPNTYSFLADYYLDMGVAGLVLAPLVVGLVIGFAHALARRRPTYVWLVFFGTVYACSTMSFMNNEWGWYVIPSAVAQGMLVYAFLYRPIDLVVRFLKDSRSQGGARPLRASGPPSAVPIHPS